MNVNERITALLNELPACAGTTADKSDYSAHLSLEMMIVLAIIMYEYRRSQKRLSSVVTGFHIFRFWFYFTKTSIGHKQDERIL